MRPRSMIPPLMVSATGYDVGMDAETESTRGLAEVDLGGGRPMQLELHQLELRYEALRRRAPEQEKRLLAALAQHGQQAPIVVVGGEGGRAVVVDGYKRLRALRQLKADTVLVTTRPVLMSLPVAIRVSLVVQASRATV